MDTIRTPAAAVAPSLSCACGSFVVTLEARGFSASRLSKPWMARIVALAFGLLSRTSSAEERQKEGESNPLVRSLNWRRHKAAALPHGEPNGNRLFLRVPSFGQSASLAAFSRWRWRERLVADSSMPFAAAAIVPQGGASVLLPPLLLCVPNSFYVLQLSQRACQASQTTAQRHKSSERISVCLEQNLFTFYYLFLASTSRQALRSLMISSLSISISISFVMTILNIYVLHI